MTTSKYTNDSDKAYGLAGMIFTLNAFGTLNIISRVTIDTDGPLVTFIPEYYHITSPAFSPKAVWQQTKQYWYLTSAMIIGNIMARSIVRDNAQIPPQILTDIHSLIITEAQSTLSLETDEAERLYDNLYNKNQQLFYTRRYHPLIHTLSTAITNKRSLSLADLLDLLPSL